MVSGSVESASVFRVCGVCLYVRVFVYVMISSQQHEGVRLVHQSESLVVVSVLAPVVSALYCDIVSI